MNEDILMIVKLICRIIDEINQWGVYIRHQPLQHSPPYLFQSCHFFFYSLIFVFRIPLWRFWSHNEKMSTWMLQSVQFRVHLHANDWLVVAWVQRVCEWSGSISYCRISGLEKITFKTYMQNYEGKGHLRFKNLHKIFFKL